PNIAGQVTGQSNGQQPAPTQPAPPVQQQPASPPLPEPFNSLSDEDLEMAMQSLGVRIPKRATQRTRPELEAIYWKELGKQTRTVSYKRTPEEEAEYQRQRDLSRRPPPPPVQQTPPPVPQTPPPAPSGWG